ncbi:hypothetical protein NXC12_CH03782 [Rhizobium etli]|uniref:DoxX family protein n=1 Tax=Rhizobium etli TaxID=29449 RepID=A0AAN1BI74_RHIET|nr:hypothetical protein NXC12_CH03782 [Rhizobium etli]
MLSSIHLLQPHLLNLLRIISSLVLFSYGTQKILHFPAAASVPPMGSLSWIAGLLELTLGFLVLVGFQTRIAAFVLSG